MNGNSADPAKPKLAIQPMEPVSSQGWMRRPVSFIKIGYIGPSTKPTKETATASPMSEGTSHTMSSRLYARDMVIKMSVKVQDGTQA